MTIRFLIKDYDLKCEAKLIIFLYFSAGLSVVYNEGRTRGGGCESGDANGRRSSACSGERSLHCICKSCERAQLWRCLLF